MPQIIVTERQKKLFDYIQTLDKEEKHVVKIFFRGREPWEIEPSKPKIKL